MVAFARVNVRSYITRPGRHGTELLVFDYRGKPKEGTHLPGGGIEAGERPDSAARREAVEETGVDGRLELLGVVGVQQGTYKGRKPRISVYLHFSTDEQRDAWEHVMIGDDDAWDTGLIVECRFVSIPEAARLLPNGWHRQDEFLGALDG